MRKSMVILLLAWWLVAPAWGAELPREVRDALPAAAEEISDLATSAIASSLVWPSTSPAYVTVAEPSTSPSWTGASTLSLLSWILVSSWSGS